MPNFTPTEEQLAIIEAAQSTDENLMVVARAGAAKTSTLVLIAEALPKTSILCLAFNKAIAQEMTERLPSNCEAKTLHALGFQAWRSFIRPRCNIRNKMYGLVKQFIDNLEDQEDRAEAFETLAETLQFCSAAKQEGWLPENFKGHWKPLLTDSEFLEGLPMEPTPLQEQILRHVIRQSFEQALEGDIDFDDMIYCPALCSVSWPAPPVTLIDESQDLSPINHHILKRIVRNRRIIAVGDPLQAIYGFRGALADSMDQLQAKFDMTTLHLTISFRCGKKIVENAHWLAPDMRAPEWAAEGEVARPVTWSLNDLRDGDAVVCRNNAPLFSLAFRLLENDQLPVIAGKDIAAPLKKIMQKLGNKIMSTDEANKELGKWEAHQLNRARDGAKSGIRDRAECIRIMLSRTKTLGDAIHYLDHLLERDGRIQLMTVHKSKGLEFSNVWFLDQHLCRIDRDQDANLKYVAETRAKSRLVYINTKTCVDITDET